MKSFLAACALAGWAFCAPPSALAEDALTLQALALEGFEVRAAAPYDADGSVVLYLQSGRDIVECVRDVRAGSQTCAPIAGELVAADIARRAVIAFFEERGCRYVATEANRDAARAFFDPLGVRSSDAERALERLIEDGAILQEDDTLTMIEGCES